MHMVRVRGVTIGQGRPKIAAPIVGATREDILRKAAELTGRGLDLVEWRADFFEAVRDTAKILQILSELRGALGELPILFTLRTRNEGGELSISPGDYAALNRAVAESRLADLIDVEVFAGGDIARETIAAIHATGVLVVGSNHDFASTPPKEEIVRRLCEMQRLGADIPKIAVMPTCRADVLTLLAATGEMYERHADRPIVTMAMASVGVISRLCGEVFGSAITFGAVGQVSAPGQIPVEELAEALDILHRAL